MYDLFLIWVGGVICMAIAIPITPEAEIKRVGFFTAVAVILLWPIALIVAYVWKWSKNRGN